MIWEGDGWSQHYKALVYYAEYLREIGSTLLHTHRLVMPDWDFCISEGADIVNTLHYYVIGDPIAFLSVFVPTRFMHLFYSVSCVLRMYLAGCAFSALAFGTGIRNRYGILAGTLSYAFCGWTIFTVSRHPYFLNPLIWFPLMILGIEKTIRGERPYLFVISAAISALSNFYFFYVIAVLAILYAIIRLADLYGRDVRGAALQFLRLGVPAVTGVLIACILFLPIFMMFLQDARMGVEIPWKLFYSWNHYSNLPSLWVTHRHVAWICIGLSAPAFIAVLVMMVRKGHRCLKTLFILCNLMMIFPACGRIMNGFAYATNRWSWAVPLLCAYILAVEWEDMCRLDGREWRRVLAGCIAYFAVCLLFDRSRTTETLSAVVLIFLGLLFIREHVRGDLSRKALRCALCLLVCVNAFSLEYWNYTALGETFLTNEYAASRLRGTEAALVRRLDDGDHPRYSGRGLTINANMIDHVSSTQYYWSNSNPYTSRFRTDMMDKRNMLQKYEGYDERTALLTLSAVKYYVSKGPAGDRLPYGYKKVREDNLLYPTQQIQLDRLREELGTEELTEEQEEMIRRAQELTYYVYENQYPLPIGYCYDSYMPQEEWDQLDPVQKQEIQLETVSLGQAPGGVPMFEGREEDYTVPCLVGVEGEEITQTEEGFVTTRPDRTFEVTFTGLENAETYLCLEGLDFRETFSYDLYKQDRGTDPQRLYNNTNWRLLTPDERAEARRLKILHTPATSVDLDMLTSAGEKRSMRYITEEDSFTSGRHDYIVSLGYHEEPLTSVSVTLPERGIYSLSTVRVYCIPMDDYPEKVAALRENSLQDIRYGVDSLSGTVSRRQPGVLCVAIPYSDGWTAFIDGQEAALQPANERYLGVPVPAGDHTVTLRYSRPYKKAGFVLSLVGLAAFAGLIVFTERRRRKGAGKA